jgi:hypothetical protein
MTVDGGQWSNGKVTGFTPVAYTGNGGTQSLKTGFSPDLVWIKCRGAAARDHLLFDTIRGATNYVKTNVLAAEQTNGATLTSFDLDGFTLGGDNESNFSGDTYVAWCWDAGDTTVTNNDGDIESQVRSNGNFSVISYTGTGVTATVGHGLSSTPGMYITKNLASSQWQVSFPTTLPATSWMNLNETRQVYEIPGTTDATSSVLCVPLQNGSNLANNNFIAYAWAETPGVSSFGTYTGNNDAVNGPVIDCGFKPAFIMIKTVNVSNSWRMFDTARSPSNPVNKMLLAETPGVEGENSAYNIDVLPNGFQLKNTRNGLNALGETYIYAAFAGTSTGETQVTGQPLVATANDVNYLDGNTLGVSGVSGKWKVGLNAQGAEVSAYAPSPQSIVFTSMNGGTTPFTSTDASLTSRTWTLEKGNSAAGPWTEVGTYLDFAANESQDGATPWNNPDLEPNKFYQVKVKYDSNNADSVESTFNTFKTGDA